jgi:hypothetical protein
VIQRLDGAALRDFHGLVRWLDKLRRVPPACSWEPARAIVAPDHAPVGMFEHGPGP